MKLVMLGAPGAGKGTQAELISKKYNVPHISTGDILRDSVAKQTELGMKAKTFMDAGELVPDQLVIDIVKERLGREDCGSGFILDGFPRTVTQAQVLQDVLEGMNRKLDAVLDIEVSEEELVHRLTQRRQCRNCGKIYHLTYNPPKDDSLCDKCGGEVYQRADDEEVAIKKRLEEYKKKTQPLISYYEELDISKVINGAKSTDEVFSDIEKVLEAEQYDN